jgi:hypothetical protein
MAGLLCLFHETKVLFDVEEPKIAPEVQYFAKSAFLRNRYRLFGIFRHASAAYDTIGDTEAGRPNRQKLSLVHNFNM